MNESKSISVKKEIYEVMGSISEYSISPNDNYLQISFQNYEDKQNYVQIIDLQTRDVIFSIANQPFLKFAKGSKYFTLEYRDDEMSFISIKNLNTRKKQLFSARINCLSTVCLFELKYGKFLYAVDKQIKICKKNKMIRKIILPQSLQGGWGNEIESIDYNPREDLILIKRLYTIYIISLVTLRIFTYEHPHQINQQHPINQQPEDLTKRLRQANFFKYGVITLEERGELKYWEFNYQNQSFVEKLNYSNCIDENEFIVDRLSSFQSICQEKYIVLIFQSKLIILDQNLLIITKINTNNTNNFYYLWRRINSQHKICVLISRNQIEIYTLSEK